ncbi:YcnI family copper-binding membrane protein [Amycolatopsis sp. H20-H5]|uniref:YcnI family copper-binding membrane protein n=1 Tax=Amycolatopsis sp. H20-H5 TaxID=3046309 RepID=UPI002DBD9010|nr:YcnI family protein [Amycolatopsis sp. H20-H5]MEC3982109.1 YcnI family protein [Amycolatopsis sp. H20-H5]
MSHHVLKRAGLLAATVGVTGLLGAGIASAHVSANVYGPQLAKGGYGAIVFRVPNEDPAAGTTKVEIALKPEYGIGSARTKPLPGWTAVVTKSKLPAPVKTASGTEITEAVTSITWTAQPGTKIGGTEYQEFDISAGPLPSNVDEIEFPAKQTYDSGKVVDWNQPTPAGGEEPEYPAPALKLGAAESGDGHAAPAVATAADGHTEATAASSSDNTARWLGGAGLVVGALGLGVGVGVGATLRARKAGAAAASSRTEGTE